MLNIFVWRALDLCVKRSDYSYWNIFVFKFEKSEKENEHLNEKLVRKHQDLEDQLGHYKSSSTKTKDALINFDSKKKINELELKLKEQQVIFKFIRLCMNQHEQIATSTQKSQYEITEMKRKLKIILSILS